MSVDNSDEIAALQRIVDSFADGSARTSGLTERQRKLEEQIWRERLQAAIETCRCGCKRNAHTENVAGCRGCRTCFSFHLEAA
jgi:hypothetical protein